MTYYEYYLVFPNGERQEVERPVQISSLVDMNGQPLPTPLPTNRIIAYQVAGKRTFEERGRVAVFYVLEQLNANELLDYV